MIVDVDEGRLIGRRRVGVCIGGIDLESGETLVGTKGEEKPHAGLLDTGGVGISQLESGGSTRGAITAVPGLASAIRFERIVPMLTENDGIGRWETGRTIHFLFIHGVELLELGGLPLGPVGEPLEFAARKAAESLLLRGAVTGGVERPDQEWWAVERVVVVVGHREITRLGFGFGQDGIDDT